MRGAACRLRLGLGMTSRLSLHSFVVGRGHLRPDHFWESARIDRIRSVHDIAAFLSPIRRLERRRLFQSGRGCCVVRDAAPATLCRAVSVRVISTQASSDRALRRLTPVLLTGTAPVGTAFFSASTTTALSANATTGGWTFNPGTSAGTFTVDTSPLVFNAASITISGGSATISNDFGTVRYDG